MHVVLLGHGSRRAEWATSMEVYREMAEARFGDGAVVTLCYIELSQPTFLEAMRELPCEGQDVHIIPLFISVGVHLTADVDAVLLETRLQERASRVTVHPPIGQWPAVQDAVAATLRSYI